MHSVRAATPSPGTCRSERRLAPYVCVLVIPALLTVGCATPVPKARDSYKQTQVPQDHMGLPVDLNLLATARLDENSKQVAEGLLHAFHATETSLNRHIEALEENLEANEGLKETYSINEAIVGALAGLSAPAVIVATAAIALPILGVLWVAGGLTIQHVDIDPKIEDARNQLKEARALAQLYPDVERAFDAVVFVESEKEADRRFGKWKFYTETLLTKVVHFFSKPVEKTVHTIQSDGGPDLSSLPPPDP